MGRRTKVSSTLPTIKDPPPSAPHHMNGFSSPKRRLNNSSLSSTPLSFLPNLVSRFQAMDLPTNKKQASAMAIRFLILLIRCGSSSRFWITLTSFVFLTALTNTLRYNNAFNALTNTYPVARVLVAPFMFAADTLSGSIPKQYRHSLHQLHITHTNTIQATPYRAPQYLKNPTVGINERGEFGISYDAQPYTLAFYTAPKPFLGANKENQIRAIRSWLSIVPKPQIILLGNDPTYVPIAKKYGLIIDTNVDQNFLGIPLFNSMVEIANNSQADVTVLINSDILVFHDFSLVIQKLLYQQQRNLASLVSKSTQQQQQATDKTSTEPTNHNVQSSSLPGSTHSMLALETHWIAVGARWDIPSLPNIKIERPDLYRAYLLRYIRDGDPYPTAFSSPSSFSSSDSTSSSSSSHTKSDQSFASESSQQQQQSAGVLHTYGGIDMWAWTTGGPPLFRGHMPHFVYGRGKYDNWMTHEVIAAGSVLSNFAQMHENQNEPPLKAKPSLFQNNPDGRMVIDVSEACTLVHVKHDYHHVIGGDTDDLTKNKTGLKRSFWNSAKRSKFELYINSYLASNYGSYTNQAGTILHTPYKIGTCHEYVPFCIFARRRPHVCRCEYSSLVTQTLSDPFAVEASRVIFCGLTAQERNNETPWKITGRFRAANITAFDSILSVSSSPSVSSVGQQKQQQQQQQLNSASSPAASALEAGHHHFGLPILPEPLAGIVSKDTTILLTASTWASRWTLMSLVCNLRRLKIDHFAIAALEDAFYSYAFLRGLPVYLESIPVLFPDEEKFLAIFRPSETNAPSTRATEDDEQSSTSSSSFSSLSAKKNDVFFDNYTDIDDAVSEANRAQLGQKQALLTELRLRIALRFLRLGYDVIWSDPEVWWIKNPVQNLEQMDTDFAFATRAKASEALNSKALSLGFFYIRRSSMVEKFLDSFLDYLAEKTEMIKHSNKPFEEYFVENHLYDMICGAMGEGMRGSFRCASDNSLVPRTVFLDTRYFMSSSSEPQVWLGSSKELIQYTKRANVVHIDHTRSRSEFRELLKRFGLDYFRDDSQLCRYY